MPTLANITVKKNDGVTDIVWTGVVPSSGDSSPAVWRSQTVGTAPGHQPQLTLKSRYNGPKTARRLDGDATFPSLVLGSDGKTSIADRLTFNFSAGVPQGMSTTDINEAVSQICNLVAATLIKDSIKTGFAPT